jgi:AcrR family transcriptional regulator
LLKATTELLADAGPSAVTTRAIAERANVNHALIFRHFESKADLMRAALDGPLHEMAHQMAAAREGGTGAVFAVLTGAERNATAARMLARVAIDPESPFQEHWEFPLVRAFLGDATNDRERTARAIVASAMLAGWVLLEPLFTSAAELDAKGTQLVRALLQEQLERLLSTDQVTTAPVS